MGRKYVHDVRIMIPIINLIFYLSLTLSLYNSYKHTYIINRASKLFQKLML